MDDDFTYFVKILDDNGDRYYLKTSIDERTHTILMQLTNLRVGWIGACKFILLVGFDFLKNHFI
jgi:hypothetical protein